MEDTSARGETDTPVYIMFIMTVIEKLKAIKDNFSDDNFMDVFEYFMKMMDRYIAKNEIVEYESGEKIYKMKINHADSWVQVLANGGKHISDPIDKRLRDV